MKERTAEARWIENQSRWCCRVMVNGKRKAFYSTTAGRRGKREAERKADEWISQGAPDTDLIFETVWKSFLDWEKKTKGEKNSSYLQHKSYGKLYILPYLQTMRLTEIKPLDWKRCIQETYAESVERGKPLSAKTLKNIRGTLTSFKAYCDDIDIALPSFKPIKIPENAITKERKILQPEDVRKLFAPAPCACDTHYLYAWQFQALTGLRPGELYGLMWSDVADDIITISRSINCVGEITNGKNKNARRTFKLPAKALSVLAEQKAHLKTIGVISPYVFPSEDGNAAVQRTAYAKWTRFANAQGITACSAYELRHTMISISADIPDALLKSMVGHGRNMDTRGVYGHTVKGDMERTASMVSAAFDRILDATLDAK